MFVAVLIFLVSSYIISFSIPQFSATGIDSLLGTVIATFRHHCNFFCLRVFVCMYLKCVVCILKVSFCICTVEFL